MKGIPIVTVEKISKNRYFFRFSNGDELIWTFYDDDNKPIPKNISMLDVAKLIRFAMAKLYEHIGGIYLPADDEDQLDRFDRPISKGN